MRFLQSARKHVGTTHHKPVGTIPYAALGACRVAACYALSLAGTILSRREQGLPYSNPIVESRKVRCMTPIVFHQINVDRG